jgi:hypothetical protein
VESNYQDIINYAIFALIRLQEKWKSLYKLPEC